MFFVAVTEELCFFDASVSKKLFDQPQINVQCIGVGLEDALVMRNQLIVIILILIYMLSVHGVGEQSVRAGGKRIALQSEKCVLFGTGSVLASQMPFKKREKLLRLMVVRFFFGFSPKKLAFIFNVCWVEITYIPQHVFDTFHARFV